MQKLFGLILVLALLATSGGVSDAATSFSPSAQDHVYVYEKSAVLDTPYHVSSGCEYCSDLNCEGYLICEDWESGDAGGEH